MNETETTVDDVEPTVIVETTIEATPVIVETTIEATPVIVETTIEATPVIVETTVEPAVIVETSPTPTETTIETTPSSNPETPALQIVHATDSLNEEILRLRQENAILAHQNQELNDALRTRTENQKPVAQEAPAPHAERYAAAVALAEEVLFHAERGERGPRWNNALQNWIQTRKLP